MTITYLEMKTKLERDMDLEGEEFIQEDELRELFNDAIRKCEAHIHKLGLEDVYFKTKDNPSLVSGTSDYAMPTNIYANKILECVYANNTDIFEVKRLKGRDKHVRKAEIEYDAGSNPRYLYDIRHDTAAGGVKWVLVPSAKETSTNITRWYIRKVQQMTVDASICDLPEVCYNFIYAYVYWRAWGKEGDARATDAKNAHDEELALMLETLAEMTPDEENEMEMDTSHYDDMA